MLSVAIPRKIPNVSRCLAGLRKGMFKKLDMDSIDCTSSLVFSFVFDKQTLQLVGRLVLHTNDCDSMKV